MLFALIIIMFSITSINIFLTYFLCVLSKNQFIFLRILWIIYNKAYMTHNYLDYIHKNLKQILLFLYLIPKYKSILRQAIVLKEISTLSILDFLLDIFLTQSILFFLHLQKFGWTSSHIYYSSWFVHTILLYFLVLIHYW